MGRRPKLPYEYLPYRPRVPNPSVVILVSDTAWASIMELAVKYGFVKGLSRRARGIDSFFYHLANPAQTWTDARPEYLVELSEKLLDPAFDSQRRKGAERTPTYLFDRALPTHARATTRAPGAHHAIWWDPDLVGERKQRRITSEPNGFPLDYFADLAMQWGIEDPRFKHMRLRSRHALASNAVEAIGHQHLVPSLLFHNPDPPLSAAVRTHRNKKEIDW